MGCSSGGFRERPEFCVYVERKGIQVGMRGLGRGPRMGGKRTGETGED